MSREIQNPAVISQETGRSAAWKALQKCDGEFKVISPNGYIFQVTCCRGRRIRIREIGESEPSALSGPGKWQIEQIA